MKKLSMEQRIMNVLLKSHGGMTATAIVKRASVGKKERERLFRELDRMRREGRVARKTDGYVLAAARAGGKPVEATVTQVHEKFGFARTENGEELFLPGRLMHGALPGDRVLIREQPRRGELREGEVIEIVEEGDFVFSGVFRRCADGALIGADSGFRADLSVPHGQTGGARDGDKVVARISKRGERHRDHRAQILAVTGSAQDARACSAAIVRAAGIPTAFSQEALALAKETALRAVSAQDLAGRTDLRDETIFTIDGASAKDLDDAVSLRRSGDGWELGVHIADVSHYVRARSALDLEAFERGTSIYYADQVIPMLPPELSNGICSLNADEDRLAFSAILTLDENGGIRRVRFHKSVIRSCLRGVYSEVNQILESSAEHALMEKYRAVAATLRDMEALAVLLRRKRTARGAIDLSSVESSFCFDEQGVVCGIVPRRAGRAEGMIEEFMILANEAVAAYAQERQLPFVYRVHENPPAAKIDALLDLLRRLGIEFPPLPADGVPPRYLQGILESVRGSELESIVNSQILRGMAKARYQENNTGHYGLVLRHYCHFTSPIRRYPDLAIHRILTDHLSGKTPDQLKSRFAGFAHAAADQSSARELRAMTAERNCESCFMAQYMAGRIGRAFDGVIASAAPHGLYVRLADSVEGMVPIQSLEGDDFDFDGAVALTGRWTGKRYRVGDPVRVMVVRADVSSGQIDFSLLDAVPSGFSAASDAHR